VKITGKCSLFKESICFLIDKIKGTNYMQDFIGKRLKYKDTNDQPSTVVHQEDGWLMTENNQRIPVNKVGELFEEVKDTIDPDMFLNDNSVSPTLLNVADDYIKALNGQYPNTPAQQSQPVDNQPMYTPPTTQIVESRAVQPHETHLLNNTKAPAQPKNPYMDDEWLRNQGIPMEGESSQHRVVRGEDSAKPYRPGASQEENQEYMPEQAPRRPVLTENPATSMFKNLKKSHPVNISLQISESIPKIESIRHLNDLFEFSIIDYLAKEITNKYLQDPEQLEKVIREKLELLVYPSRKKKAVKKTTRKPAAKATAKPATRTTPKKRASKDESETTL
jgi:hypothetical protein